MDNTRAAQLLQQQLYELNGAALRALAVNKALHYREAQLFDGTKPYPLQAPHLQGSDAPELLLQQQSQQLRGVTDGVALRIKHSDAVLHGQLRPEPPLKRLVFEILEQLRVETLIPAHMLGQRSNVRQRFVAWADGFYQSGLAESAVGLLLFTVTTMCWARLNSEALTERVTDLIEGTRAALGAALGGALQGLHRQRGNQAAYAPHAQFIASFVAKTVADEQALRAGKNTHSNNNGQRDKLNKRALNAFAFLLDMDTTAGDSAMPVVDSGHSAAWQAAQGAYRVFTRQYDQVSAGTALVRDALLPPLRAQLDDWVAAQGVSAHALVRQLRSLFAQPQLDGWHKAQVDGMLDTSRLAQRIVSHHAAVHQHPRFTAHCDTAISVLVDCSGSMKTHLPALAPMLDVMVKSFEKAGIACELLGYSTRAWNGGRTRKAWLTAGSPPLAGRLNEVCHRVFKPFDTSYARSRTGIAALLKTDLYREGVDGEAVVWAAQRLSAHGAQRKIVLVISDGCPMDSATQTANDTFYLDNHLKHVVAQLRQQGVVQVRGLGVGLDLSPYYPQSLGIDLQDGLSTAQFKQVFEFLAR